MIRRVGFAIGWLAATVVLTFQKWGYTRHEEPAADPDVSPVFVRLADSQRRPRVR